MATRLKTIHYAFPTLATLPDNTLTSLSNITAYIPEFSGTVTFKKVIFCMSWKEHATMAVGNYSARRMDIKVGGATAVTYSSTATVTSSGEQMSLYFYADATSNFQTNWTSGTSQTIGCSVLVDSAATTIAMGSVDVTFYITYEYNDTASTQIKTVFIPLNSTTGALATSKPGTPNATIEALDTTLPEASKTYRNMFIVCQGNVVNTGSTTDSTLSMQIDTYTAFTSQTLEMGATSDYWTRFVWDITSLGMDTSSSHGFYIWASVARHHHQQVYLVVTYEFDASSTTSLFNSIILPFQFDSSFAGWTTNSTYNRAEAEFYIEEPGTITTKNIAAYLFWEQSGAVTHYVRLGSSSFTTYNDAAAVLCGSNGCMISNSSAFTLARGKNKVTVDVYTSSTSLFMHGLSGFFIVNYTSSVPSQGAGAANKTVFWHIWGTCDTAEHNVTVTNVAISIPETYYFISSIGIGIYHYTDTTATYQGCAIGIERLSSEGGVKYEVAGSWGCATDPELGLHVSYSHFPTKFFQRFPNEISPTSNTLLDPETARSVKYVAISSITTRKHMEYIFTYHSITYSVSGQVTGYSGDGSGLTVTLHDATTGRALLSTTTSTGGSYSITWYDNAHNVYTECYQSATRCGRSADGTAS